MPASFKIGAAVRQVMPAPVQGEVVQLGLVGDGLGYLVRSDDGTERWFAEEQLEAVAAVPPVAE